MRAEGWRMMAEVRAPFPWFGGKRRVADVVWRAFGVDVPNYVEPFAGSLAVLLGRPGGAGKIETVNDLDRYLANFWRAVTADPEAARGYAGAANTNRARERIWFSPHCLPLERSSQQMSLLGCEGRSA